MRRVVIACLCALALPLAYPHSGGAASTPLGGVDFDGYCRAHGYDGSQLEGPVHGPNAAYGWRCVTGSRQDSISVTDVCREEYGDSGATASPRDINDAYSWVCYAAASSPAARVGTLLLDLAVTPGLRTAHGVSLNSLVLIRERTHSRELGVSPRGARVNVQCVRGCHSNAFTMSRNTFAIRYLAHRTLQRRTVFIVTVTRRHPAARGPRWHVSIDRRGFVYVSDKRFVGP